jgi:DNA-binding transcriptional LysR family regulator
MLDSHRLKIFAAVAELKSFSKAAKALYLTQPTVSQQITALEFYIFIK